ncbi:MAG TPA: phosphotransferase [Thermoanaerobaculia bacterium]|nr:phosphotransferase [Thermoanaerobaculia bacterium]
MIHGKNEVVHYLLERGLLDARDVVAGDLVVVELIRRHHNFAVMRGKSPGIFVKQIQDQPMAAQTLQKEAAFYALLDADPALAPIRALLPKFHAYDPDRHMLVVEMVAGAEDVNAQHRMRGEFSVDAATRIGQAIASYHDVAKRELVGKKTNVAIFTRTTPWILSFHLNRGTVQGLSAANGQLMQILQSYPEFALTLDHLRNTWRYETLIHGDMKFDNCLVTGDTIHIVDWEIAEVGDSAWDVGSIFQAYLMWWLSSLPANNGGPDDVTDDKAAYPLEKIQPAIRAFWNAYASASHLEGAPADAMLERATACAGARLLQTVYESLNYSPSMTPNAIHEVQAAVNILRQPRAAAADLLGIPVGIYV